MGPGVGLKTGKELGDGIGAVVGFGTGMNVGAHVLIFDAPSSDDPELDDDDECDTHLSRPSPPQKNAMAT
jgi:hypothetical protein